MAIIEVTGPHDVNHQYCEYKARCTICSATDSLRLLRDSVKGDLGGAIKALLEGRLLPEPLTRDELHLQEVARETVELWRKELKSYGCKHIS